jgi:hypothetical protein
MVLEEHQQIPHGGGKTGIGHPCLGTGENPVEIFI